jgi:hypothetical protein
MIVEGILSTPDVSLCTFERGSVRLLVCQRPQVPDERGGAAEHAPSGAGVDTRKLRGDPILPGPPGEYILARETRHGVEATFVREPDEHGGIEDAAKCQNGHANVLSTVRRLDCVAGRVPAHMFFFVEFE